MKEQRIGVPHPKDASGTVSIIEIGTNIDITDLFRPIMIAHAIENDEALIFNEVTGRAKRVPRAEVDFGEVTRINNTTSEPTLKK